MTIWRAVAYITRCDKLGPCHGTTIKTGTELEVKQWAKNIVETGPASTCIVYPPEIK